MSTSNYAQKECHIFYVLRSPNWTAKREKKVDVLRNHNHHDSYHEYRRNIQVNWHEQNNNDRSISSFLSRVVLLVQEQLSTDKFLTFCSQHHVSKNCFIILGKKCTMINNKKVMFQIWIWDKQLPTSKSLLKHLCNHSMVHDCVCIQSFYLLIVH